MNFVFEELGTQRCFTEKRFQILDLLNKWRSKVEIKRMLFDIKFYFSTVVCTYFAAKFSNAA